MLPEFIITALVVLVKIPCVYLLADLLTGIIHWVEDVYGNPSSRLFGKLIFEPNVQHHLYPRKFLSRGYWGRNNIPLFVLACSLLLFWLTDFWHWELVLLLLIASQANEVHCFAHRTASENGWLVTRLQRVRIIQGRNHHLTHHKSPFDIHYCILTDFMNPVLDKVKFWEHLESSLAFMGIRRYEG